MFYRINRVSIPPISCDQLGVNSFVASSFDAVVKDHRPLHDIHRPDADSLNVPKVRDFMAASSEYL
jgi:hypothetical protein